MTSRNARPRSLASLLLALAACHQTVVGDGVFEEETRTVPAFTGASVEDGITVEVTAGAQAASVKVSGDENVLEHVVTEVVDEAGLGPSLVVRLDVDRVESTLPLRVTVSATVFRHVRAVEDAAVDVKGAGSGAFDVHAGQGAEVLLSGAGGDTLDVVLWGGAGGGAALDARSYVVKDAAVSLSGGALAELHVDESVTGVVSEGSTLVNLGEGTCSVAVTGGSSVACAP